MGYVFISYVRNDAHFAELLASELRQKGVEIWIDRQEIQAGDNWAEAIDKAIAGASVYLMILSRNALNSAWMWRQADHMRNSWNNVIPLVLENFERNQLPDWLLRYQYIVVNQEHLQQTIEALLAILPPEVKTRQPIVDKVDSSKGSIFISYADEDDNFVGRLITFLEQRGYGYWDYKRSNRDYELPFHLELERAIDQASAMLCVVSPQWKESIWTAKEYLYAEHPEVKTPTIVLQCKPTPPTLLIIDRTYIDFTESEEVGFVGLDRELRRKGLI